MTITPYPISGTAYEEDGSTSLEGAVVTIFNVTKQEWMAKANETEVSSDSDYTIDAANLPTTYTNGDKLQVLIYKVIDATSSSKGSSKVIEYTHTIDTTGDGHNETSATKAHVYQYIKDDVSIMSGFVSNSDSSNSLYVDFYDRENDERHRVQVPSDNTVSLNFLHGGMKFKGGYCIVFEDYTENYLDVALVIK